MLHFHLTSAEDDDTFQVTSLEDVLDDVQLLCLVANVCFLLDFLCRFADCQLDFHRILEQCLCQFLNLVRHRGREHDGLASLREFLGDSHDVLRETHVEHTVSLVEYEETYLAEIHVAHIDVGDETAWCGDDHVGSHTKTLELLVVAAGIVATINSHAAHAVQIVTESLHGLVYLLC